MDESTITRRFSGSVRSFIPLILAIMAGCETCPVPGYEPLTETEIAVLELKQEWLKECDGVTPTAPANNAGNLLEDYTDVSEALARCMTQQRGLAEYARKVHQKAVERRSKANTPKK